MSKKEYLAANHTTMFIVGRVWLTMLVMVIDEKEMKRGKQEYRWKKVAKFKRVVK